MAWGAGSPQHWCSRANRALHLCAVRNDLNCCQAEPSPQKPKGSAQRAASCRPLHEVSCWSTCRLKPTKPWYCSSNSRCLTRSNSSRAPPRSRCESKLGAGLLPAPEALVMMEIIMRSLDVARYGRQGPPRLATGTSPPPPPTLHLLALQGEQQQEPQQRMMLIQVSRGRHGSRRAVHCTQVPPRIAGPRKPAPLPSPASPTPPLPSRSPKRTGLWSP